MAQELDRVPQIVREHTALPFRRLLSALLWPGFRIGVPLSSAADRPVMPRRGTHLDVRILVKLYALPIHMYNANKDGIAS
jgi:hypothetical protein